MSRRIDRMKAQFRQDLDNLRKLSGRKKLQFIWDYYKLPIISAALVLVFLILALVIRAPQKDTAVYVVWVNSIAQEENGYFDDLLARTGADTEKQHADVNTSLSLGIPGNEASDAQTLQVLAALFGIGDLDLFISDADIFENYAVRDAFADLSELLEPELLSALHEYAEERVYYITDAEGKEIIAGYRIPEDSGAAEAGYFTAGTEVITGVLENALNRDTAVKILQEMIREDLDIQTR